MLTGGSGFAGSCIAVAGAGFPGPARAVDVGVARGPVKQCQNTNGAERKGSCSDQGKAVT